MLRRHVLSRTRLLLAVAALAVTAILVPTTAPAAVADSSNVSIVSAGVVGASSPSISGDGRWAVYEGVTDDGRRTVYRTDLANGTTADVAVVPDGVRSGDTIHPVLSADGCVIVATTQVAFDLFRDDDRGERWDVYRLVLPECGGQANGWELISRSAAADTASDAAFVDDPAAVSGSGAVVAYTHQLPGAPSGVATISLVDTTVVPDDPGRVMRVAGVPFEAPSGVFKYRGARQPVLSQNGRHLAFVSDATASAALPGWADGPVEGGFATSQVYVWDRGADDQRTAVHLVSGRDGEPSAAGADSPAMSESGRVIAFRSTERTLVPAVLPLCQEACATQIYRFDRDVDGNGIFDEPSSGDPLSIVSAVDAGRVDRGVPVAGDASSRSPAVSADGSQVAFVTDAANLVPTVRGGGGSPEAGDLLVAEVHLGAVRRVLGAGEFASVAGAHDRPAFSTTGQRIVFESAAGRAIGTALGVDADDRVIVAVDVVPQLSLAELDFGSVIVGFESAEMYTSVINEGPGAFAPQQVTATGNFRVTGGTCAPGIIVAAGAACTVEVTFTPSAPRSYTGTVAVTGSSGLQVSAEVRGTAGEPILLANPGGVDLDPGVVGQPGDRVAIDIDNVGFVPAQISSIRLEGAHPDDFSVVTESCRNRYLNPEASCAVEVQITPTSGGYRSALLVVQTDVGDYTTAVLGGFARFDPRFEIAPAPPGGYAAGGTVGVGGEGFPPDTEVAISFGDGTGVIATVTSTDLGEILAEIDLPVWARSGQRELVAVADGGVAASAPIVVQAPERSPWALPGYGIR